MDCCDTTFAVLDQPNHDITTAPKIKARFPIDAAIALTGWDGKLIQEAVCLPGYEDYEAYRVYSVIDDSAFCLDLYLVVVDG